MKESDVRAALLDIEESIRGSTFENWRKDFVRRHLDQFSFEDENKLIYTDIHREFEEGVETHILDGLPKKFDYEDFQHSLPSYIDGPGKDDEATGKAITMLLQVADFEQFKTMMMFYRREKEEDEGKHSGEQLQGITTGGRDVSMIGDVEGMMNMCAQLATAADNEGWTNCLKLDWMTIDKKPVEPSKRKTKNDIYLRGVWTMNITYEEACDMMFEFDSKRRPKWDPNFKSCHLYGASSFDDDLIATAVMDFGYLTNLVMFQNSTGLTLSTRNFKRWNQPTKGMMTYAMVPWDIKNNVLDTKHKLLSLKTGTIAPHPTLPGKCVMTTLEINGMGGMPTFALNFITRVTAPQMMRSLESRYIANARNKGDFVDMTPEGRNKPPTWRTTNDEHGKSTGLEGPRDEGKSNHK